MLRGINFIFVAQVILPNVLQLPPQGPPFASAINKMSGLCMHHAWKLRNDKSMYCAHISTGLPAAPVLVRLTTLVSFRNMQQSHWTGEACVCLLQSTHARKGTSAGTIPCHPGECAVKSAPAFHSWPNKGCLSSPHPSS